MCSPAASNPDEIRGTTSQSTEMSMVVNKKCTAGVTSVCTVWLNLLPAVAVTRALTPDRAAAMGTAVGRSTTGVRSRMLDNSGTSDACHVPRLCLCDPCALASGIPSPVTVPSSALPTVLILLPTLPAIPVWLLHC